MHLVDNDFIRNKTRLLLMAKKQYRYNQKQNNKQKRKAK